MLIHFLGCLYGLCHCASREEMSQGGQGTQSCGVWMQLCCLEHLSCSTLLEGDRKARISGTNPTFNLHVVRHSEHKLSGSSESQNWVEIVSKSSSYTASVINVHQDGTKRSHCYQSTPAHHPHLLSADCSCSTGYFYLVAGKADSFFYRKGMKHKEKQ